MMAGSIETAVFHFLICDDRDAPVGTWVHWVLYDLPVTASDLAEKVPASESLPFGAKQGINDFKRVGYDGQCPPPGKPHRGSQG